MNKQINKLYAYILKKSSSFISSNNFELHTCVCVRACVCVFIYIYIYIYIYILYIYFIIIYIYISIHIGFVCLYFCLSVCQSVSACLFVVPA